MQKNPDALKCRSATNRRAATLLDDESEKKWVKLVETREQAGSPMTKQTGIWAAS